MTSLNLCRTIAFVMLFGTGVPFASGAPLLIDDFDGYPVGSPPPIPWTILITPSGGSGVNVAVDDAAAYSGNNLHFVDTNGSAQIEISRPFLSTATVCAEYFMFSGNADAEGVFCALYGDAGADHSVVFGNAGGQGEAGWIGVYSPSGWIETHLMPYTTATWYYVRRELNCLTDEGSVYVEELVAPLGDSSNVRAQYKVGSWAPNTYVDSIHLWTSGSQHADANIDELRIRSNPIVTGHIVSTYATVVDPMELAFAPSGVLYVGRDDSGSGGSTSGSARIHRIGLGGTSVKEYGDPITDPDATIFDATGWFSGTPGSVLVGGIGDGGSIRAILPDETSVLLWNSGFSNPTRMTFDNSENVLFFSDPTARRIFRSDGAFPAGAPYTLVDTGNRVDGISVAPDGRIFTRIQSGDRIQIYDANTGVLLDPSFAAGLQFPNWETLAFGHGGAWGTDLYTISGGDLLRFDAMFGSPNYGDAMTIGTGFATGDGNTPSDITFGPDGSLYISMFSEDRILKISPDCNANGIPDHADILVGTSPDCNTNGIPDECELIGNDCNTNGIPDKCDPDFDGDGVIDDCDPDIDSDGVLNQADVCDYTPALPSGAVLTIDGTLLGDLDGDCDVDLADFAIMQPNFTGSNPPPYGLP